MDLPVPAQPGLTAFLGLSHLGIVSSAGWASHGQPTLALDPDPALVEHLRRGDLPIHEPGLPELLQRCRGHLDYSADLARLGECSLVVIARDVPTDEANASDLGPVLEIIDQAAPHLRQGVALVVMCQVPPGFTRALGARLRAARPGLAFDLVYWVETLVFGDAVRRCLAPERCIVGQADPDAPLPPLFDQGLRRFNCPVFTMSYESAELTKTAINLYLIGSVTYANAMADLCEAVGADWSHMVPALRLDRRIGPYAYLRPGLGVAGGNLERDLETLRGLCRRFGVDATYVDTLADLNQRRFDWVLRALEARALGRPNPRVAIWGLTYKKDTRATKNSPALRLIDALATRARLCAWDPTVAPGALCLAADVAPDRDAVLDGADCLAIMADWDHFAHADLDTLRHRMRRPLVVDTVGILANRRGEMQGIDYVTMGLGVTPPPEPWQGSCEPAPRTLR